MDKDNRVCILVLGDVGHSPRMQYHALSLAANNFNVDIVGYKGSKPHEAVLSNKRISIHQMDEIPNFGKYYPRLITYVFKVIWQIIVILKVLLSLSRPDYILVQNPPSIPTLMIAFFHSKVRRSQFVIDWHNYGFTILALTLGPNHLLVKVCRWFEGFFGSKANHHLCVTKALKNDLYSKWKISATVLYDRPPDIFKPIHVQEKHELYLKLKNNFDEFFDESDKDTLFTRVSQENDKILFRNDRPALVVSSTSWTEDEDFNILLEALEKYDNLSKDLTNELPRLYCVITGKGPLKGYFQELIDEKNFQNVKVVLLWLSAEDYPKLLGSCDFGISLHKSSSKLDLPMKVVDMFGCGLPVCAYEYECISELVLHQENGLLFKTSDQLVNNFKLLLKKFPNNDKFLRLFRENIRKSFLNTRWDQSWQENAFKIFEKVK